MQIGLNLALVFTQHFPQCYTNLHKMKRRKKFYQKYFSPNTHILLGMPLPVSYILFPVFNPLINFCNSPKWPMTLEQRVMCIIVSESLTTCMGSGVSHKPRELLFYPRTFDQGEVLVAFCWLSFLRISCTGIICVEQSWLSPVVCSFRKPGKLESWATWKVWKVVRNRESMRFLLGFGLVRCITPSCTNYICLSVRHMYQFQETVYWQYLENRSTNWFKFCWVWWWWVLINPHLFWAQCNS
jgi:hypothetical protein